MNSHDSTSSSTGKRRKPEQLDAKSLASARRDALLRRARRIRRSVASLAAVLFSTAFLVIYVQLASGHDPALVANAKRTASTSTTTGSSKASTASTSSDSSSAESTPTTSTQSSTTESTPSTSTESSGSESSGESSGSASSGESSGESSSSSSEESSSGTSAVTTSQS
jgi:hypothetical protein